MVLVCLLLFLKEIHFVRLKHPMNFAKCLLAVVTASSLYGQAVTIFAFDDVTIAYKRNLALTMVPATKHPQNPVLPRGPAGSPDAHRAQFYGSVIRVDGKYRMWYTAEDRPLVGNHSVNFRPAYAESTDGIKWTRPELGLVEFNGNKKNNLISFSPQPHFELTEPLASFVLYEPDDPNPAHRYKMALYGRFFESKDVQRKTAKATFYPYFSADGLRWTLTTPAPKSLAYDETEVPFPVKSIFEIGGLYKFGGLYYVAGQEDPWSILLPTGKVGARVMTTHWSSDFIHWSKEHALSFARYGYRSETDLNEAHEPAGVWNRGNVLIATYGLWQGSKNRDERRMPLGLLISNDGIHFREPQPDFVFLAPGAAGEWDQHGLIHGQGYENVGDQTYVYYGTWDLSAKGDPPGAVGLATLRRDGFGYLSPRLDGEASFVTSSFPLPRKSSRIVLNAEGLGPEAKLRIELLDEKGVAIPQFSGKNAAEVAQNGVAVAIPWKIGSLGQARMRVQFEGSKKSDIRFYCASIE